MHILSRYTYKGGNGETETFTFAPRAEKFAGGDAYLNEGKVRWVGVRPSIFRISVESQPQFTQVLLLFVLRALCLRRSAVHCARVTRVGTSQPASRSHHEGLVPSWPPLCP